MANKDDGLTGEDPNGPMSTPKHLINVNKNVPEDLHVPLLTALPAKIPNKTVIMFKISAKLLALPSLN